MIERPVSFYNGYQKTKIIYYQQKRGCLNDKNKHRVIEYVEFHREYTIECQASV